MIFGTNQLKDGKHIESNESLRPQEIIFYYDLPAGIGLDDITVDFDDHNFKVTYSKEVESEDKSSFKTIEGGFSEHVSFKLEKGQHWIKNNKLWVSFENGDEKKMSTIQNQN
ncbi:hypothetical protein CWI38_0225p0040 [Hamiltosporidium tvaerminnensis]|uniref:Uncharacterized protein n=1 Tax=Hamiltosporidium tvaerminnensis TaxID=1176355 RepID=A0A4Q9LZB4_9MICR|nr:hypothetical protein CWI38_0225p0040 [Hamiltosporidium tvaerminnensis]